MACNDLEDYAPVVSRKLVASAPPSSPAGGVIASGTYYVTSSIVYGATGTCTVPTVTSETVVIAACSSTSGRFEALAQFGTGEVFRQSSSYATDGTALTITYTCPALGPATGAFTATSQELTEYVPACGGTWVVTFTRQ